MSSRTPMMIAAILAVAPNAAIASGGESGAGADGLFLVPMDEIVVPIVDGPQANGRLRLKLVLKAADPVAAARLQADMPALREASFAAAAEFARLYASPFSPVDAKQLATDMNAALHAHDHGISATLLTEVAAMRA